MTAEIRLKILEMIPASKIKDFKHLISMVNEAQRRMDSGLSLKEAVKEVVR